MIDSYKTLTLGKFMELQKIDWASMEEIDVQVKMLSILSDMDEDEILKLPLDEYSKMVNKTSFLSKQPEISKNIPDKIKINDKIYVLVKDIKKMTAGQYIDYQQYLAANDINFYLPYILSCFIIPKGKTYGDYDIEEVVETIKNNLSVVEALSISGFFMKKFRTSIKAILLYLDWKIKKMMKMAKDETVKTKLVTARKAIVSLKSLMKDGDGYLV